MGWCGTKDYGILNGLFSLELSFTKIEMERWSKNQEGGSTAWQTSKRKHQHPKIEPYTGLSTRTCRGSANQIRLRKCLNEVSHLILQTLHPRIMHNW